MRKPCAGAETPAGPEAPQAEHVGRCTSAENLDCAGDLRPKYRLRNSRRISQAKDMDAEQTSPPGSSVAASTASWPAHLAAQNRAASALSSRWHARIGCAP